MRRMLGDNADDTSFAPLERLWGSVLAASRTWWWLVDRRPAKGRVPGLPALERTVEAPFLDNGTPHR